MPQIAEEDQQQQTKKKSVPPAKRRLFGKDDDVVEHKDDGGVVKASTPEKKKQRVDTTSNFFSPKKQQQSTTSQDDATTTAGVVVTPEKVTVSSSSKLKNFKDEKDVSEVVVSTHVPIYIHKNLEYQRKGQATLSNVTKKVYGWIEQHYDMPSDFENNIHKYGPISGTCYEERTIKSYDMGLLQPKTVGGGGGGGGDAAGGDDILTGICSECACTGHKRIDCPELI
eukprot:CAMPEP_0113508376 /NCGR_PEP_ID=MMETSP0014_2-20120614/36984_1 /TAXON_ID=2857 /ORGANISM="Nitzschia sp." /LENGTH=225 /DNA_ID=CAMNT_0000404085 /DNA_START=81 /DNA_END=758 /DNA_ORIENTATION=- /assembly_acc=CAM_ASM_000159